MATEVEAWTSLRRQLQERLTMARQVLDQAGYSQVATLIPIEEVLIWMDELLPAADPESLAVREVRADRAHTRYFLTNQQNVEIAVSKPVWVRAERAAGFYNTLGQPLEPATASWASSVCELTFKAGRTEPLV